MVKSAKEYNNFDEFEKAALGKKGNWWKGIKKLGGSFDKTQQYLKALYNKRKVLPSIVGNEDITPNALAKKGISPEIFNKLMEGEAMEDVEAGGSSGTASSVGIASSAGAGAGGGAGAMSSGGAGAGDKRKPDGMIHQQEPTKRKTPAKPYGTGGGEQKKKKKKKKKNEKKKKQKKKKKRKQKEKKTKICKKKLKNKQR